MKTTLIRFLLICLISYSSAYSQGPSHTDSKQLAAEEIATSFRYYYYPNLQAYYDVQTNLFLFRVNKEWITAESIPESYGGYSLYSKHRVKITDYDGDDVTEMLPIHKLLFPYNAKGRLKKGDS